jgi:tetratricopeptide (TPR) repeat protein
MLTRRDLREQIANLFKLEELELLCRDLHVDPENIPGRDQGKAYFVDQLIDHFHDRDRLSELRAALEAARPKAQWQFDISLAGQPQVNEPGPRRTQPALLAAAIGTGVALVVVFGLLVTAQWPGAVPTVTPTVKRESTRMQGAGYNIFVADIGQLSATGVQSDADGQMLSAEFAAALRDELADPTVLPADVRYDFPVLVWTSRDAAANGWDVTTIRDDGEAQRLAQSVGAQLVIYGNFSQDVPRRLELGAYLPRGVNVVDELNGRLALGQPLAVPTPMDDDTRRGLRLQLNDRQRLLSRWAVGLLYDTHGRPAEALAVLQQATARALRSGLGVDVSNFLVGRQHLLLGQPREAEAAHQAALAANPNYIRAYLGLGDVYLQQAGLLSATEAVSSGLYLRSFEAYSAAEAKAALQPEARQLLSVARLGMGIVNVEQGVDLTAIADDYPPEAQEKFLAATRLLQPELELMARDPEGVRRTLALGYFNLARAYRRLSNVSAETDKTVQTSQFRQAESAYEKCVGMDGSWDEFLAKRIIPACAAELELMRETESP